MNLVNPSSAFRSNRAARVFVLSVALLTATLDQLSAQTAQPVNLSTRMVVQTGDYAGIGGFIVRGTGQKNVLLRVLGPSLSKVGVPNVLANPALELRDSNGVIATNNNWRDTYPAIEATGMQPASDLEPAIAITLGPDENYTAIVKSEDGTSGLALLEIYDLNPSSGSKLANISTRAVVTPGDGTLIAGIIISGTGTDAIVVRGLGPSVTAFTPLGPLIDPVLQLHDNNGALIAENDNWAKNSDYQKSIIVDAGLSLTDPHEAAIAAILPAGNYTALLTGSGDTSGVGLVELYDLNSDPGASSIQPATVTRFQTGTFANIEAQHVVLDGPPYPDTFRLVFTLPSTINQSPLGSRAALKGVTAPISSTASAAEIQSAIVAIRGFYAYGQLGHPELIEASFSAFADIGAVNRDPIVTGSPKEGFTIYFGSTVGSPTAYNTWVAGLPLVSVAVP